MAGTQSWGKREKIVKRDTSVICTLCEVFLFLSCLCNSKYKITINIMSSFLVTFNIESKLYLHLAQKWHNAAAFNTVTLTFNCFESSVSPKCISNLTSEIKKDCSAEVFSNGKRSWVQRKKNFFFFLLCDLNTT